MSVHSLYTTGSSAPVSRKPRLLYFVVLTSGWFRVLAGGGPRVGLAKGLAVKVRVGASGE